MGGDCPSRVTQWIPSVVQSVRNLNTSGNTPHWPCLQMIGRRCALFALGGLLVLVLTVNIYFIRMIVENSPEKSYSRNLPVSGEKNGESVGTKDEGKKGVRKSMTREMEEKIKAEMRLLPSKYFKRNSSYAVLLDRLLAELRILPNAQKDIWSIPNNNWPDAHQLLPAAAPELGTIFEAMRRAKIVKADNAPVGTQLKLMLTLESGVKALFKPQWYARETILNGPVYFGKDRHNAEVVAFHLSSLLGLRRVPLTIIRKRNDHSHSVLLYTKINKLPITSVTSLVQAIYQKLKLSQIRNCAAPKLYETLYQEGNETCFYGVCHYCSPADPVCSSNDILEGALILWLPDYLKLFKHRHPWQRTYKRNKLALWETDIYYCDKVKETKTYAPHSSSRLLDLIDTAVFDYLMDNGDRHHYELTQNNFHNPAVLLIDNGKSLANPDVDHVDILAPLYQCCMIHKTTWDRLQLLGGGALSVSLGRLLAHESTVAGVQPLITEDHLSAMDRRLLTIYAVVEYCLKIKKYSSSVILDHR